jgi:hypothetical protein
LEDNLVSWLEGVDEVVSVPVQVPYALRNLSHKINTRWTQENNLVKICEICG